MNVLPPIVFFIVVAVVFLSLLKEIKFSIPKTRVQVSLDYAVPPLIGVFILFICGAIDLDIALYGGLIGHDKIEPFAILIIFHTLAYITISIDLTGLLACIALHVAQMAGNSAFRLFTAFYIFAAVFTIFTSNDVVILTLTPIIFYCTHATQVNPFPFLFAEFFAANISSMVLLIGNPTNIIVAQAINLTFAGYSKWMAVISFVATATCYGLLYFVYRTELSDSFELPTLDPASAMKDKKAAIFHTTVLLVALVLLFLTPWLELPLWMVCSAAAFIVFSYNAFCWPWYLKVAEAGDKPVPTINPINYNSLGDIESAPEASKTKVGQGSHSLISGPPSESVVMDFTAKELRPTSSTPLTVATALHEATSPPRSPPSSATALSPFFPGSSTVPSASPVILTSSPSPLLKSSLSTKLLSSVPGLVEIPENTWAVQLDQDRKTASEARKKKKKRRVRFRDDLALIPKEAPFGLPSAPCMQKSLMLLPWRMIPFTIGMFVLVEALVYHGYIDFFADLVSHRVPQQAGFHALLVASFLLTTLTIVLSNMANNQPATILLTRLLLSSSFHSLPLSTQHVGMFAVILGSNISANFTILGSLAGMMFVRILREKQLAITPLQFAKMGLRVMPFVSILTTATLCLEFYLFALD